MHTKRTRFFAAIDADPGFAARAGGAVRGIEVLGVTVCGPTAGGVADPVADGLATGLAGGAGPRGPSNRWRVPLKPPLVSFGSPPFGTIRVFSLTLPRSCILERGPIREPQPAYRPWNAGHHLRVAVRI